MQEASLCPSLSLRPGLTPPLELSACISSASRPPDAAKNLLRHSHFPPKPHCDPTKGAAPPQTAKLQLPDRRALKATLCSSATLHHPAKPYRLPKPDPSSSQRPGCATSLGLGDAAPSLRVLPV